MDKKTKTQFKELLTSLKDEKEQILEEYERKINSSDNNNSDSSSYPFHSADIGTDAAMLESDSINLNELINEVRLIDEALAKLSNGDFGVCEMCGEEITKKRLKAIPYAKLCIDCKEKIS